MSGETIRAAAMLALEVLRDNSRAVPMADVFTCAEHALSDPRLQAPAPGACAEWLCRVDGPACDHRDCIALDAACRTCTYPRSAHQPARESAAEVPTFQIEQHMVGLWAVDTMDATRILGTARAYEAALAECESRLVAAALGESVANDRVAQEETNRDMWREKCRAAEDGNVAATLDGLKWKARAEQSERECERLQRDAGLQQILRDDLRTRAQQPVWDATWTLERDNTEIMLAIANNDGTLHWAFNDGDETKAFAHLDALLGSASSARLGVKVLP